MSNTGVSTLFSKIFVQTLNPQHAGKKTGKRKPPPNPILGTQCGGLDLWLLISQHYPESR